MDFPGDYLNKVLCGDCLELLNGIPDESIGLILTSPPYNIHNSTGGGLHNPGESALWKNPMKGGYEGNPDNMPYGQYVAWQRVVLSELYRVLKPDGALFYNHKWRVQGGLLEDRRELIEGLPVRQVIIWDRGIGMNFNSGYFLPTYEVIYLIAKPDFKLVKGANAHKDVWHISPDMNNEHPAPFPLELAQRVIESTACNPVLDPFCGSGTTLVAARRGHRDYIGFDIVPTYVAMSEQRILYSC